MSDTENAVHKRSKKRGVQIDVSDTLAGTRTRDLPFNFDPPPQVDAGSESDTPRIRIADVVTEAGPSHVDADLGRMLSKGWNGNQNQGHCSREDKHVRMNKHPRYRSGLMVVLFGWMRPADSSCSDDIERAHHFVILMREDVTVPHVSAGKVAELHDDARNFPRRTPHHILPRRFAGLGFDRRSAESEAQNPYNYSPGSVSFPATHWGLEIFLRFLQNFENRVAIRG